MPDYVADLLDVIEAHRPPWPTPGNAPCSCGTLLRRSKRNDHHLGKAHDQHLAEVLADIVGDTIAGAVTSIEDQIRREHGQRERRPIAVAASEQGVLL